jgi:hypothetical protein
MISMVRHRIVVAGMALGCLVGSCGKRSAVPPAADPQFDKRWAELAKAGVEVSYVEDDRGEGLMGNVRRASRAKADPPGVAINDPPTPTPSGLPDQPPGDQVHRIIRSNLMAVRGCYMSVARAGQARSGKAIVSFSIGADGKTTGLRVDAPSFVDTPLPGCVAVQISRWEFPKSQKGSGEVSYPFVFVGG